jgi:hypothetical protein
MDPETLRLLQKAVSDGILSASWIMVLTAVISAGVGAFLGSYLKKKGEDVAIRENFQEVLRQLKAQTEATEEIKFNFGVQLKKMESDQAQHNFLREVYGPAIREYSTSQALGLREAWLLLFEEASSSIDGAGKTQRERVDMAIQQVIVPLRKYIGLLDEPTVARIYAVHDKLLDLRNKTEQELRRTNNDIFNATDSARQFVKADKIAARLGLIDHPLEEAKP